MVINMVKRRYSSSVPDANKKHACTQCDYKTDRSYSLKVHMYTHSLEKNFSCTHDDCDYTTNSPLRLKTHMLRHLDILPFTCEVGVCNFSTTTKGQLEVHHQCMHSDTKEFECDFPGCDFTTKLKGNLEQHKITHSEELPFECTWENCNFKTKTSRNLKAHILGHTGRDLKFICEICGYKTAYKNHLKTHMRGHNHELIYECDFSSCNYKTISISHLHRHKVTHTKEKKHACTFPGCEYRASYKDDLTRHKKTHTLEGQRYHKKQERRVTKVLSDWGYDFDDETTINASRGNCLTDTNRHFSRLDYHIINATKAIVLLEVDEEQHLWYNLSCEFSRMSDVRASLMTAGYELPIYWIRYSPTGKYHVDFDEVKVPRAERELSLKAKLDEVCSPNFEPKHQVQVHYLYYDLMSKEMGPSIQYDPDFPEAMRGVVSWSS